MASDDAKILAYFTSNIDRVQNSSDQLGRAAVEIYGLETEDAVRSACNETKLARIRDKLQLLSSEMENQRRLECEMAEKHATLQCSMRNFNQNGNAVVENFANPSGQQPKGLGQQQKLSAPIGQTSGAQSATSSSNAEEYLLIHPLTEEEFANIPKYMKSSRSVADVNTVVAKLNEILDKKYRILSTGMKAAKTREAKDEYLKYKQEDDVLKGERACLESELRESLSPRDVSGLKTFIPILRHLRRIKDIRVGKVTYLQMV